MSKRNYKVFQENRFDKEKANFVSAVKIIFSFK